MNLTDVTKTLGWILPWAATAASFFPGLGPIVGVLAKIEPIAEKAAPALDAAWEKAAPELAKLGPALTAAINLIGKHVEAGMEPVAAAAKATAQLIRLHAMTPEEEARWMQLATTHAWGDEQRPPNVD